MDKPVNLKNKFNLISDHWNPAVIAELNGQQVKLAKILGEFVMHFHENEDEMFLVVKGSFDMKYEDRKETLHEGELIVVPSGVMHQPIAHEEAWILLFEPASTLNTGNVQNQMTRDKLNHI